MNKGSKHIEKLLGYVFLIGKQRYKLLDIDIESFNQGKQLLRYPNFCPFYTKVPELFCLQKDTQNLVHFIQRCHSYVSLHKGTQTLVHFTQRYLKILFRYQILGPFYTKHFLNFCLGIQTLIHFTHKYPYSYFVYIYVLPHQLIS